jgi:hypothetical protein
MRYYTYVSDAKLDMLYEQIPPNLLSRIVAELKLDIKVISVSIKERQADATRFGKLAVVESYIDRHFDVGTISDPALWFRGQLNLRSGIYGDDPSGLVYFSGIQEGALVALIGSAHHLIGQRSAPDAIQVSYSRTPALFTLLHRSSIDENGAEDQNQGEETDADDDRRALTEVRDFANSLRGVRESSEFLARRLLRGPVVDGETPVRTVLLGTPLYVALTGN